MNALFNMDNPLMRALGRLADLMILNIIFIICCLPIFTIGASLTAMNYVTLKMHDGAEGYVARSFFKSFRQNFKQSTGMWLIELFIGIVLVLDIMIMRNAEGTFANVMTVAILIVCALYLMIFLYLFAVLSRFENTIKNTFKNAFVMAVADFPRTILMFLIVAAFIIVTFFNSTTLLWGLLLWILFGFSLVSYCNTYFLSKIFKKYMPEEEDDDPDHWDIDQTMGPADTTVSSDTSETEQQSITDRTTP